MSTKEQSLVKWFTSWAKLHHRESRPGLLHYLHPPIPQSTGWFRGFNKAQYTLSDFYERPRLSQFTQLTGSRWRTTSSKLCSLRTCHNMSVSIERSIRDLKLIKKFFSAANESIGEKKRKSWVYGVAIFRNLTPSVRLSLHVSARQLKTSQQTPRVLNLPWLSEFSNCNNQNKF